MPERWKSSPPAPRLGQEEKQQQQKPSWELHMPEAVPGRQGGQPGSRTPVQLSTGPRPLCRREFQARAWEGKADGGSQGLWHSEGKTEDVRNMLCAGRGSSSVSPTLCSQ